MLKAKQSESTPTNPEQSLLAFKPRQVLLIEQSSKTNTMKHCNSNSSGSKCRARNPDQKALLLHSVLRYLEHNGFSRTHKRLLSEAQIGKDKWKTCSLDLEDMFGKYLPTDSNQSGTANKFTESAKNSGGTLTNNLLTNSNVVLKKKKTREVSNSFCQTEQVSAQALMEATVDAVGELNRDESTNKHNKKKKKSQSISESIDGNVEQVHLHSLPAVNNKKFKKLKPSSGECKFDSEAEVKLKDKKKKIKVAAEDKFKDLASSAGNNKTNSKTDSKAEGKPRDKKKTKKQQSMDLLDENPIRSESEKQSLKTSEHVIYELKKSSKKRKRLENEGQPGDILVSEELKRRKTELLEGTKNHGKRTEANVTTRDNEHAQKERKGENGHVGQNEFQNTSIKQREVQANGDLKKNGEKSAARKPGAKQYNCSVEPKTANAFQRVKLDEVEFADDKLQDNSYWAKDGAEVGYGAKAQEILGQVRGRDFRHEKTKKKRGSYRGGQIDLQSHSVKFNYSEDD